MTRAALTLYRLSAMLNGVDPKTGEKMTEDSVIDNMITFLIAGHETTSGLLSFAFFYMLKNPSAYEKAQQEVDEIIGKGPITVEHLSKLPYLNGVSLVILTEITANNLKVLRETLRLSPTAPAIGLHAKEDTVLGAKYHITKVIIAKTLLWSVT